MTGFRAVGNGVGGVPVGGQRKGQAHVVEAGGERRRGLGPGATARHQEQHGQQKLFHNKAQFKAVKRRLMLAGGPSVFQSR